MKAKLLSWYAERNKIENDDENEEADKMCTHLSNSGKN
jgi:hypothetical protein